MIRFAQAAPAADAYGMKVGRPASMAWAGAMVVVLTGVCAGQTGTPTLRPVEQGYADTDPFRTSFRSPAGTLQQDVAFEQVYQGADGKFYRVSGAMYAQFERSVYLPTGWGAVPVIPPGTVFYIGAPPELEARHSSTRGTDVEGMIRPEGTSRRLAERLDDRVPSEAADTASNEKSRPVSGTGDAGTMSDEATRQRRLAEIAAQAAQARS